MRSSESATRWFDDLPGAGKPLDLSDAGDPDWWVKRHIRDQGGDLSALAPTSLLLRRERERLLEGLCELRTEQAVREAVADFNQLVRDDMVRPAPPGLPRVVVRTIDVEEAIAAWRARPAR